MARSRLTNWLIAFSLLALLLSPAVYARMTVGIIGGSVPTSGTTQLYTDATAIYDFDNDTTDEKGTYDLSCTNCPDYVTDVPASRSYWGTYSADFNGTDDICTQASLPDLAVSEDYSIAFWFKIDSSNRSYGFMGNSTDGEDGTIFKLDYNEDCGGSGRNDCLEIVHMDSWSGTEVGCDWYPPSTNTWYHVVIVYDYDAATELTVWVSSTSSFGDEVNGSNINFDQDAGASDDGWEVGNALGEGFVEGHLKELVIWQGKVLTSSDAEDVYDGSWR